jgi:hypothetical protein
MKTLFITQRRSGAWLLCLLFSLSQAAAQFVVLTAEMEITEWGGPRRDLWAVRCVVGTNSWQMEGEFLEGAKSSCWITGNRLIENNELSRPTTGQTLLNHKDEAPGNSFAFAQVATPVGQRWTSKIQSNGGNPSKGVGESKHPDRLTRNGRIAWLAFCSSPCLKREGRHLFPPSDLWKELIDAPQGFLDRTTVFGDTLGLPKSVNLYTATGQPVLQYRMISSTNVLGWEFPQEFCLAQYQPAYLPDSQRFSTNSWELDFTAKGKVTSIGVGTEPAIPPEVLQTLEK